MSPKQRAGEAALEHVRDGMIVGLGTGSTARFFIQAVATALRDGRLHDIRAVPTSKESERLAREAAISVITFKETDHIDVTVDGADEIAPDLTLIKGHGGALLREKVVAQNSRRLIIIADESKVVKKLGTQSPLPVETTPFGFEATERYLASLGCTPVLRKKPDGAVYVTDNGNFIFDCRFAGISDPIALEQKLETRAGIVESGLFIGLAEMAIVATEDSVRTIKAQSARSHRDPR